MITELPEADEPDPNEMYDEADREVWELVQRKLTNANSQMRSEQNLAVLMHCIDMGEAAAGKAEGKAIVILVGNTGSGKSTFVNILHDCKMKQYFKRGTKTKVKRDFTTTCSRRPCTASAAPRWWKITLRCLIRLTHGPTHARRNSRCGPSPKTARSRRS